MSQPDRRAKPERHSEAPEVTQKRYEHEQITDNRLLWEVLEGNE